MGAGGAAARLSFLPHACDTLSVLPRCATALALCLEVTMAPAQDLEASGQGCPPLASLPALHAAPGLCLYVHRCTAGPPPAAPGRCPTVSLCSLLAPVSRTDTLLVEGTKLREPWVCLLHIPPSAPCPPEGTSLLLWISLSFTRADGMWLLGLLSALVQPWPVSGIQQVLTEHWERMEGRAQALLLWSLVRLLVSVTSYGPNRFYLPRAWHCVPSIQGPRVGTVGAQLRHISATGQAHPLGTCRPGFPACGGHREQ